MRRYSRAAARTLSVSLSTSSSSSSSSASPETDLKEKIFSASLPHVAEHGWGCDALTRGAVSAGLSPSAHAIVFGEGDKAPGTGGGEIALVNYYMRLCNARLKSKLSDRLEGGIWDEEGVGTLERYEAAIRIRLNMNAEHIRGSRWHEAMAVGALPSNALTTSRLLGELIEIICDAGKSGGDLLLRNGQKGSALNPVATYGERAAVGAVYLSTELFMLSDKSEDFSDTWRYLRNRMAEIGTVGDTVAGKGDPSDAVVAAGATAAALGGACISLAGPVATNLLASLEASSGGAITFPTSLFGTVKGFAGSFGERFESGTDKEATSSRGNSGTGDKGVNGVGDNGLDGSGGYGQWEEELPSSPSSSPSSSPPPADPPFDAGVVFK